MQSMLGEFSLTAAIVTYAVIAIAGLALMAVLRGRRRLYPRNRHPT